MSQPSRRQNKINFLLLFLLPVIVIFDLLYYLINRSSCLNCGNLSQFFSTSSLSAFLIGGFLAKFRKNKRT
ncbi:hypothetical protein COU86_02545 [Candidatus Roizmanbacteria bacterium CG10_big_fil_rev_8_21_14_0_10_36_26]|uniref:Uncharacterized protein n=1 Tax=Candidatus Roizmanbacteria bacterium CG10_big_fil_rev_8_21_14_0_10_36_26 TaxID=1974851 RepID=A0A2M8KLF5_9BACT|nr:MAG: hypothetical protein COU86_02545 [Candidatus Roizmanbacteria bacterium CG10_big_fil_rev_8_21_14_0_10_36_26]